MRTFLVVCYSLLVSAQYCTAQLSVNPDYQERNGLTVASSQTITVPAKVLRGFITLESKDLSPRDAVAKLKAKKKAALDALSGLGIQVSSIEVTTTKILEWEKKSEGLYPALSNSSPILPEPDTAAPLECTAVAYISFDVPLTGVDSEDLTLLPDDICKRLRKQEGFASKAIVFLFVGRVEEAQADGACKKAYREALAKAKSVTALSGRSLGKLVALTPEMDGRWKYWSELSYRHWDDSKGRSPLVHFRPAEDEIFGNDPSKLTRAFSIELRFNIE